jgi:hypothetical protein
MSYHVPRYFCPNLDCVKHNQLLFAGGECEKCRKPLERIKYCPNCDAMGIIAQNRLCYKCNRYLVDLFAELRG